MRLGVYRLLGGSDGACIDDVARFVTVEAETFGEICFSDFVLGLERRELGFGTLELGLSVGVRSDSVQLHWLWVAFCRVISGSVVV